MTVIDREKAINYLCKWMKDCLSSAGKEGYYIYYFYDELPDANLLENICKKARIPYESFLFDELNLYLAVKRAKKTNSLITSSVNRSKYRLIRDYPKYFNPDVAPLADLFRSEIAQLLGYFGEAELLKDLIESKNIATQASWKNLEWADREDAITKIIINNNDPVTNHKWSLYNMDQKRLIARMNQLETMTRHKQNPNLPVILRIEMSGLKP